MGKRQLTITDCQEGWANCWKQAGMRRVHVERNRSGWLPVVREKLPRLRERWARKLELYKILLGRRDLHAAGQFSEQAHRIWSNIEQTRPQFGHRWSVGERKLNINPAEPCLNRKEYTGAGGHRAARRILAMRGIPIKVRYGPRWQSLPTPRIMVTNYIATFHAGGTDESGFAQTDTEAEAYAYLSKAREEGRLNFEFDSASILTLQDGRATSMDIVGEEDLDRYDEREDDDEHDEHDEDEHDEHDGPDPEPEPDEE